MATRKKALTTGEVASICSVSPQTVIKWFDSGKLRGYKLPGSKDRRIPLDNLIQFLRDHDIPAKFIKDHGISVDEKLLKD